MIYRTTKKDFEFFKKECEYWLKRLELSDWQVYYDHQKLHNCFSRIALSKGNIATITLSTELDMLAEKDIKEKIKNTAKHEVLHILLSSFVDTIREAEEKEEEKLIHKLIKILK